jgi:hypothetical protein
LAKDKLALATIQALRPAKKPAGIATIGYEGRTLEAYLNTLLKESVTERAGPDYSQDLPDSVANIW